MFFETTASAFLYAAASEVADFGGPQMQIDIAVAQISEAVGEGAEARRLVRIATVSPS